MHIVSFRNGYVGNVSLQQNRSQLNLKMSYPVLLREMKSIFLPNTFDSFLLDGP